MSEFEDGLDDETEEIESFDDIRDEVRDLTSEMDFAVAAWHEDGRWTLATLPFRFPKMMKSLAQSDI